ncbi:MAG: hypothetical protein OER96_00800 [Gammaproteobacteria bacterium]|nr:hypothetical protein [Gammaproteobacteria bacterium]
MKSVGKIIVILSAFVLCATLSGCVTTKTADCRRLLTGSDKFRDYVEQVFRQQNRVTNDLIYLLPEIEQTDGALFFRMTLAESNMLKSCGHLNMLAASYRDDRKPGFFKRMKMSRNAAQCDRATQKTQTLLDEFAS